MQRVLALPVEGCLMLTDKPEVTVNYKARTGPGLPNRLSFARGDRSTAYRENFRLCCSDACESDATRKLGLFTSDPS